MIIKMPWVKWTRTRLDLKMKEWNLTKMTNESCSIKTCLQDW